MRWLTKSNEPFSLRFRPSLASWLLRFALACTPTRERAASDLIRRLSVESVTIHDGLAAAGLEYGFTRRGIVNVYESDSGFTAGLDEARHGSTEGLRYEVLTPSETRELLPAFDDGLRGAILHPDEAHADPLLYVQRVGQAAADAGAHIQLETEGLRLRTDSGRVVALETTAGPVRAESFVLAAGVWSGRLAQSAKVFVPVQAGTGYHVDIPAARSDPQLPVFLHETRTVVTPFATKLRLTGGLELGGGDTTINERYVETMRRAAARHIGGVADRQPIETWGGPRPCSPDGLPLIGRVDALPNLVIATGHATMGFTLAPVTGRIVAGVLTSGDSRDDLELVDPNRFRPWRLF